MSGPDESQILLFFTHSLTLLCLPLQFKEGKLLPMTVKEGDKVLLPDFGGNKITFESKEYFLYRDTDLLGVFQ